MKKLEMLQLSLKQSNSLNDYLRDGKLRLEKEDNGSQEARHNGLPSHVPC